MADNYITTEVTDESISGQAEGLKKFDVFTIKGIKYICLSAGVNWLGEPMPKLFRLDDWKRHNK